MIHVLALASTPRRQPFNGLFLATSATLIPVLFLALVVQGNTLQHLLDIAGRTGQSIHPVMPPRAAWIAATQSTVTLAAAFTRHFCHRPVTLEVRAA